MSKFRIRDKVRVVRNNGVGGLGVRVGDVGFVTEDDYDPFY